MPNANTIALLFGLVMILILVLAALWGFLAGLKRELKCLAVFVVLLALAWLIFGGQVSVDKNIFGLFAGPIRGAFGVPTSYQTWREVSLYIGQQKLGLSEILVEGTETYELYMNVVSMIARGLYVVLATICAIILSGLIRLITHIIELIIRSKKNKNEENEEPQVDEKSDQVVAATDDNNDGGVVVTASKNKVAKNNSNHRFWGAGVGFLKGLLIVILICAPITGIVSIVGNVQPDTVDVIEKMTSKDKTTVASTSSQLDWIFEVTEALNDNFFIKAVQSSEYFLGKSIDLCVFDSMFTITTDSDKLYVREELVKLIDILNLAALTYDESKKIPFDIWSLSDSELGEIIEALKDSKLIKTIMPVAFEYVGTMDQVQNKLLEAGYQNLNEFVKNVNWDRDYTLLMEVVRKAVRLANFNETFDVMQLESEPLRQMITILGGTTFFKELMPMVFNVALSLTAVENFAGKVDMKGENLTISWKDELLNLVSVYDTLKELNIDTKNLNAAQIQTWVEDENSFEIIKNALATLVDGELFGDVLVPILDQTLDYQLTKKEWTEFKDLISLLGMENDDWKNDLPVVVEILAKLSQMGVLNNSIKLNEYETMHGLVDNIFELVLLTDKVKSTDTAATLKTLLLEAAIRQFKFLDVDTIEFDILELRDEINWEDEKQNFHMLIDTLEKFNGTTKTVQNLEIVSAADFKGIDWNALLDSDLFWDNVIDLLDSVVDSKIVMSILPRVFEKYIAPMILKVDEGLKDANIFEEITSENVIPELYNLVYMALDLREIGLFSKDARSAFDYDLGATVYYPENGFYKSEYFTYEPKENDLALVDVIERIFGSALLEGREARIFRILLKAFLKVDVSIDELESINYSQTGLGELTEKQILISGIKQLRTLFEDPKFAIFKTAIGEDGTETRSFNLDYFLQKNNLKQVLNAVEVLLKSKIILYLMPEYYNQVLVEKGTIPAEWAEILKVQSTTKGLTAGVTALELNEDLKSLVDAIRVLSDFGALDMLNKEKADTIKLKSVSEALGKVIDIVTKLNIVDNKLTKVILKLLEKTNVEFDETVFVDIDWDQEFTYVKAIIESAVDILYYGGIDTYGSLLDFLNTKPMNIPTLFNSMTIYLVGMISLAVYNGQALPEIAYKLLDAKLFSQNVKLNTYLNFYGYERDMFKEDLLILSDIAYQLIYSDLTSVIGSFVFPKQFPGEYTIKWESQNIAYLLEDILSLNVINISKISLVRQISTMTGLNLSTSSVYELQFLNNLVNVPKLSTTNTFILNAYSTYNKSLLESNYSSKGDSVKIRELYLALIPFLSGEEFPVNTTTELKAIGKSFGSETIEAYKNSEYLNNYVLSIADALEIISELSLSKAFIVPVANILKDKNVKIANIEIADYLVFDSEYTKYDALGDVAKISQVLRDAVDFNLFNIILRDVDIQWTGVKETAAAQSLIKNFVGLKFLEKNFEKVFNKITSLVLKKSFVFDESVAIDLTADAITLGDSYPYLAEVIEKGLKITKYSQFKSFKINLPDLMATDIALNIVYAFRELTGITVLESLIPDVFARLSNSSKIDDVYNPLFDLTTITAKEVLTDIGNLTYPLEDLINLQLLDLIQKKDISLEKIDTLPGIFEEILNNHYLTSNYQALVKVALKALKCDTDSVDLTGVVWNNEVIHIVGIVQDMVNIIVYCDFQTTNEVIDIFQNLNLIRNYLDDETGLLLVSALRHLISSAVLKGIGIAAYEQIILPELEPKLAPELVNLLKLDSEYTTNDLSADLEIVLQTLETIVDGDLLNVIFKQAAIDYVGLVPDVKDIFAGLLSLQYFDSKVGYIYEYLETKEIDTTFVDVALIDFDSDGVAIGDAYELVAPLLDSTFNPYQTLPSYFETGHKFNMEGIDKQYFLDVIDAVRKLANMTLVTKNIPLFISLGNKTFKNTTNFVGELILELLNVPLSGGEHVNTINLLTADINEILDIVKNIINGGLIEAFAEKDTYNITTTLVPAIVDGLQDILDLQYLATLKGQDVIEMLIKKLGYADDVDFTTLTYANESSVLKRVIDELTDVIDATRFTTYTEFYNFIMAKQYLDGGRVINEENFTNVIDILEIFEDSELLKQLSIPLYQSKVYPAIQSTSAVNLVDLATINQSVYTNDLMMADYTSIVDLLKDLDAFGLYGIIFNNDVIDWSDEVMAENIIKTIFGLNLIVQKDRQIVDFAVEFGGLFDNNINLIDTDVISIQADVDRIVNIYHELVPILTMKNFPYTTILNIAKGLNVLDLTDFFNDLVANSLIGAARELVETTIIKGTIPYIVNFIKVASNNDFASNLIDYTSRGLTNDDIVDDLRTLLKVNGVAELLVDAKLLDLLHGIDINVNLPTTIETIVRDIWGLNLLENQYATIIKYLGSFVKVNFDAIDETVLDEAADLEKIVNILNASLQVLENNSLTYVSEILPAVTLKTDWKQYIKTSNILSILDIISDALDLTVLETTLPTLLTELVEPRLVENARDLIRLDADYTYSDLKADYNNNLYIIAHDALDFGANDIYRNGATIEWDKLKADGVTYYAEALIKNVFNIKYLTAKLDTIYNLFLKQILPDVDVTNIDLVSDADKLSDAYVEMLPVLTSSEWTYNTYAEIRNFKVNEFDYKSLLTNDNAHAVVNALEKAFDTTISNEMLPQAYQKFIIPVIPVNELKNLVQVSADYTDADLLADAKKTVETGGIAHLIIDTNVLDYVKTGIMDLPTATLINDIIAKVVELNIIKEREVDYVNIIYNRFNLSVDLSTVVWSNEYNVIYEIINQGLLFCANNSLVDTDDVKGLYEDLKSNPKSTAHTYDTVGNEQIVNNILSAISGSEVFLKTAIPAYKTLILPKVSLLAEYLPLDDYSEADFATDYDNIVEIISSALSARLVHIKCCHEFDFTDSVAASIKNIIDKATNLIAINENIDNFIRMSDVILSGFGFNENLDATRIANNLSADGIKLIALVDDLQYVYSQLFTTKIERDIQIADIGNTVLANSISDIYKGLLSTVIGEEIIKTVLKTKALPIIQGFSIPQLATIQTYNEDQLYDVLEELSAVLDTTIEMGFFSNTGVDFTTTDNINNFKSIIDFVKTHIDLDGKLLTIVNRLQNNSALIGNIVIDYSIPNDATERVLAKNVLKAAKQFVSSHRSDILGLNFGTLVGTEVEAEIIAILDDFKQMNLANQAFIDIVNGLADAILGAEYAGDFTAIQMATVTDFVDEVPSLFALARKAEELGVFTLSISGIDYKNGTLIDELVTLAETNEFIRGNEGAAIKLLLKKVANADPTLIDLSSVVWDTEYTYLHNFIAEYNTAVNMTGVDINNLSSLKQENVVRQLVVALRKFENSKVMEQIIEPLYNKLSTKLPTEITSWLDFNKAVVADVRLEEYSRLLNVIDLLAQTGYLENNFDNMEISVVLGLIDAIFGNDDVDPDIIGLTSVTSTEDCFRALYDLGLIPSIDGIVIDLNDVPVGGWDAELEAFRDIIESLGAFSADGTLDVDHIFEEMLESTDVAKITNVLTDLNNSKLYRKALYKAIDDAIGGASSSLSPYISTWFTTQADGNMNDEWDQEIVILARLISTVNAKGGFENFDLNDFENIDLGYMGTYNAATDSVYPAAVGGVDSGLRQLLQLLNHSKTFNIDALTTTLEDSLLGTSGIIDSNRSLGIIVDGADVDTDNINEWDLEIDALITTIKTIKDLGLFDATDVGATMANETSANIEQLLDSLNSSTMLRVLLPDIVNSSAETAGASAWLATWLTDQVNNGTTDSYAEWDAEITKLATVLKSVADITNSNDLEDIDIMTINTSDIETLLKNMNRSKSCTIEPVSVYINDALSSSGVSTSIVVDTYPVDGADADADNINEWDAEIEHLINVVDALKSCGDLDETEIMSNGADVGAIFDELGDMVMVGSKINPIINEVLLSTGLANGTYAIFTTENLTVGNSNSLDWTSYDLSSELELFGSYDATVEYPSNRVLCKLATSTILNDPKVDFINPKFDAVNQEINTYVFDLGSYLGVYEAKDYFLPNEQLDIDYLEAHKNGSWAKESEKLEDLRAFLAENAHNSAAFTVELYYQLKYVGDDGNTVDSIASLIYNDVHSHLT